MSGNAHEPRVVETFRLGHAVARVLASDLDTLTRYTVAIGLTEDELDNAPTYEEDELEDLGKAIQAAITMISYLAGRQSLPELARRLRGHPLEGV
jgi:hypothetical protein